MTAEEYLTTIGLGHLRLSASGWPVAPLGGRLDLRVCQPTEEDPAGAVWLRGGSTPGGFPTTPAGVAAHLEHMATAAEHEAARYRAALAVLRGEAPQPVEVQP